MGGGRRAWRGKAMTHCGAKARQNCPTMLRALCRTVVRGVSEGYVSWKAVVTIGDRVSGGGDRLPKKKKSLKSVEKKNGAVFCRLYFPWQAIGKLSARNKCAARCPIFGATAHRWRRAGKAKLDSSGTSPLQGNHLLPTSCEKDGRRTFQRDEFLQVTILHDGAAASS